MYKAKMFSFVALLCVLPTWQAYSLTNQQGFIVPPMVDVPAGTFFMGSESIDNVGKNVKPVESISDFQLSKYHITVAEFRYFAEDTGYEREATCNDYMDNEGLRGPTYIGTGRWDKHRYTYSDFQPVTCITWQDANAYANWLSEKTGHQYRLPSDIEMEYAATGGTITKYYWGDDPDQTQACQYGNFADQTGEHINNKLYGYSNVGVIGYQDCDDGEAHNAIVGLYRPNQYGLYDMLGNALTFTSSCYHQNGYSTIQTVLSDNCTMSVTRGGSWHYPAQPIINRGRADLEKWNVMTGIGFRLAKDGHSSTEHPSTKAFEHALHNAQANRKASRPKLLPKVDAVQLIKTNNNTYSIRWQPADDKRITKYVVYISTREQAHLLGLYYRNNYESLAEVDATLSEYSISNAQPGQSFRVVSVGNGQESLPSEAVVAPKLDTLLTIPGRLETKHVSRLNNINLFYLPKTDTRAERYLIFKTNKEHDKTLVSASFSVNVEKSGWYHLNYRGSTFHTGEFFSLWQGNKLLGKVEYDPNIDDKTSNRHKIYLEQGEQTVELTVQRDEFDRWGLTWLDFDYINDNK